jgi:hypothetical protein
MRRLRVWLRYRRHLTAAYDHYAHRGYMPSPPTWQALKAEARTKAEAGGMP